MASAVARAPANVGWKSARDPLLKPFTRGSRYPSGRRFPRDLAECPSASHGSLADRLMRAFDFSPPTRDQGTPCSSSALWE